MFMRPFTTLSIKYSGRVMTATIMKKNIPLILVACGVFLAAWSLWGFLGKDAYLVFTTILTVGLFIENARLRQKLKIKSKSMSHSK